MPQTTLDQIRPYLNDRRRLRSAQAIERIVSWTREYAPQYGRNERYRSVATQMTVFAQALYNAVRDEEARFRIANEYMGFLDGVVAREGSGQIGMTVDIRSHPFEEGEFLVDGTALTLCPVCGAPAIEQPVPPGRSMFVHRARVMPHGYDSLDHHDFSAGEFA